MAVVGCRPRLAAQQIRSNSRRVAVRLVSLMPDSVTEWVTVATAATTVLLAAATLWMAIGTRKLAILAERQFRADRLPLVEVTTLACRCEYDVDNRRTLLLKIGVKNVSRSPICLDRLWIRANYRTPPAVLTIGTHRTIAVDEVYAMHDSVFGASTLDLPNDRLGIMVGTLSLRLTLYPFGFKDMKETLRFSGMVVCGRRADEFSIREWHPMGSGPAEGRNLWQRWCATVDKWRRELNVH